MHIQNMHVPYWVNGLGNLLATWPIHAWCIWLCCTIYIWSLLQCVISATWYLFFNFWSWPSGRVDWYSTYNNDYFPLVIQACSTLLGCKVYPINIASVYTLTALGCAAMPSAHFQPLNVSIRFQSKHNAVYAYKWTCVYCTYYKQSCTNTKQKK